MTNTTQAATEDIVIERTFDAPRDRTWRYWTEPELLMQWWGPKTLTSPAATIDFRVGGKYHFCLRMPDGKEVWSTGTYLEIEPLERIVFTDSFADAKGNVVTGAAYGMGEDWPEVFKVILTFEDVGGGTRFTLRHGGIPAGEIHTACGQSWNESFDKLHAALTAHSD